MEVTRVEQAKRLAEAQAEAARDKAEQDRIQAEAQSRALVIQGQQLAQPAVWSPGAGYYLKPTGGGGSIVQFLPPPTAGAQIPPTGVQVPPGTGVGATGPGTGVGGGEGQGATGVEEGAEDDEEGSEEEGGEDRSAKMLEEVHKALREMKEDHAKARKEEKERQEKIEQRLDRAEGMMTPPLTHEDNRRGDERFKTNQGPEDERRAKGQCRGQLKGKRKGKH